jgi:hypothetical protein
MVSEISTLVLRLRREGKIVGTRRVIARELVRNAGSLQTQTLPPPMPKPCKQRTYSMFIHAEWRRTGALANDGHAGNDRGGASI